MIGTIRRAIQCYILNTGYLLTQEETPEIFAAFLKTQVQVAPLGIDLVYASLAGIPQK